MSYQLAYNNSESIAAIVSLAGASHADERAAPKNPVHVLQIHGTDDSTIRYEGGDIQGNNYWRKGKRNSMGRIQVMH